MKRLAALLILVGGFLVATPTPAHAAAYVTHGSPDDGYDAPFDALLAGGGRVWLYEGQGSPGPIQSIYVYPGQEIHCYFSGIGWRLWADATGPHAVGGSGMYCVMQAD